MPSSIACVCSQGESVPSGPLRPMLTSAAYQPAARLKQPGRSLLRFRQEQRGERADQLPRVARDQTELAGQGPRLRLPPVRREDVVETPAGLGSAHRAGEEVEGVGHLRLLALLLLRVVALRERLEAAAHGVGELAFFLVVEEPAAD